MNEMMIIITPERKLKNLDFEGYEKIKSLLDGEITLISTTDITVIPTLTNGEYSISIDFISRKNADGKLNAMASLISGKEIYGDVVILKNTDGVNRGFGYAEEFVHGKRRETFCECWSIKNSLMSFMTKNIQKLDYLENYFNDSRRDDVQQTEAFGMM